MGRGTILWTKIKPRKLSTKISKPSRLWVCVVATTKNGYRHVMILQL